MNGPQRTAQFVSHRILPELPSLSKTYVLEEPSESSIVVQKYEKSQFHRQRLSELENERTSNRDRGHSIKENEKSISAKSLPRSFLSLMTRKRTYSQIEEEVEDEEQNEFKRFHRQRGISQISINEDEEKEKNEKSRRNSIGSISKTFELNLQKIAMKMDGISVQSEGAESEWTFVSETDDVIGGAAEDGSQLRRFVTMRGFELYLKIKWMLSLFSLIAIAFLQIVYFRYFWLCGLFSIICSFCYALICFRCIAHRMRQNFLCCFGLLIVRIFHIVSIFTIFGGVATCSFYFDFVVIKPEKYANELAAIKVAMWIFIALSILICSAQNFDILDFERCKLVRWKVLKCCKKTEYFINDNGSWNANVHPMSASDGCSNFFLFVCTLCAVILSFVCIIRMEAIMKTNGL